MTTGYPARYPEVVSVGAINTRRKRTYFSSIGKVDVMAPGRDVYTAWPPDRWRRISGTSFASPFVSGVAALALSVERRRCAECAKTPRHVWEHLRGAAIDLEDPGFDARTGWGLINVNALARSIETKGGHS
jgi:subtilisin